MCVRHSDKKPDYPQCFVFQRTVVSPGIVFFVPETVFFSALAKEKRDIPVFSHYFCLVKAHLTVHFYGQTD